MTQHGDFGDTSVTVCSLSGRVGGWFALFSIILFNFQYLSGRPSWFRNFAIAHFIEFLWRLLLDVTNSLTAFLNTTLEKQLNCGIIACFNRKKYDRWSDLKIKHNILPIRYFLKNKSPSWFWKWKNNLIPIHNWTPANTKTIQNRDSLISFVDLIFWETVFETVKHPAKKYTQKTSVCYCQNQTKKLLSHKNESRNQLSWIWKKC